jgi:predicted TIM-barrel fold metal-dependent hydrolase
MTKLLIVSGDAHIGGTPAMYQEYIEPKHRAAIAELERENAEFMALSAAGRQVVAEEEALEVDGATVPRDEQFPGWNIATRLRDLDREGVAAEILHGGHQGSVLPFYSVMNKPYSAELRTAGQLAFHRWLADRLIEGQGRMFGIADAGPCLDLAATERELRWAAEHGFVGMALPKNTWDDALPDMLDPYYEPIWAVCEELGLAVSVHAGWGGRQGMFQEFAARFAKFVVGSERGAESADPADAMQMMEAMASSADSPLTLDMGPRRALWQLMVGGVFDRHPDLKVVMTEVRADWIPSTLDVLDEACSRTNAPMALKPSEYWRRNCFAAPSSPHTCELEMRERIGIDQFIFGTDYPHPEGTWPQTKEWIRHTFRGVPEVEARKMLADNAIRAYGLDRAALEPIAERIGPEPADVLGEFVVEDRLLDAFHKRAGLHREAELADIELVHQLLEEDLTAVGVGS